MSVVRTVNTSEPLILEDSRNFITAVTHVLHMLGTLGLNFYEFWNFHINGHNFKIFLLYILRYKNLENTEFEVNWSISFRDINFNMRIQGGKGDWDLESLIWSKTLLELIINPLWWISVWSPEGPVSQIHSPHLHTGAPGIFSDHLKSVQMLKREWGAVCNGKLPHLFISSKTATLFLSLRWKIFPLKELQPCFLSLQRKTCPWAER